LIDAVVEMKRRSPTWGCKRIAQQVHPALPEQPTKGWNTVAASFLRLALRSKVLLNASEGPIEEGIWKQTPTVLSLVSNPEQLCEAFLVETILAAKEVPVTFSANVTDLPFALWLTLVGGGVHTIYY
jgi:hypothetical protein